MVAAGGNSFVPAESLNAATIATAAAGTAIVAVNAVDSNVSFKQICPSHRCKAKHSIEIEKYLKHQ